MWKLFQRALSVVVLGAGIVGMTMPASAAEKDKVTFVLDWIIYGRHTPYFVAVEKGIFEKNNIEAKVERGYGSAVGLRRLGANQADFLFADFGGLILARANENLRAKMIALVYAKNNQAVFYLDSAPINSPKDLVGKRIAAAPGSTLAALFPGFLRANGIDPSAVRLINVDVQALNAVLLAKQFDGMLELNFNQALLEKQGEKDKLAPKHMLWADNNYSFYANGIITTDEMIAKNPDLVRRFVASIIEAMQYSFDHPDEACNMLRKNAPSVEQDICLKELAQVKNVAETDETKAKGLGFASPQGVERTISVMRDYMNLKGTVAPDEVYTTGFLPKR